MHCLQCLDAVGLAAEGHPACKNMGGWWRLAVVGPDGVVPSRMVGVSASVDLLRFSSGTGSPVLSWREGRKTVVVVVCMVGFNPQSGLLPADHGHYAITSQALIDTRDCSEEKLVCAGLTVDSSRVALNHL